MTLVNFYPQLFRTLGITPFSGDKSGSRFGPVQNRELVPSPLCISRRRADQGFCHLSTYPQPLLLLPFYKEKDNKAELGKT